jgi:hypothetical protein
MHEGDAYRTRTARDRIDLIGGPRRWASAWDFGRLALGTDVSALVASVVGLVSAQFQVRFVDVWQTNFQAGAYVVNLHRDDTLVFDTFEIVLNGHGLIVSASHVIIPGSPVTRAFAEGRVGPGVGRPGLPGMSWPRPGTRRSNAPARLGGHGGGGGVGPSGRSASEVRFALSGMVEGSGRLVIDLRGEAGGCGGPGGRGGDGEDVVCALYRYPVRGGDGGDGGRGGAGGRGGDGGEVVISQFRRSQLEVLVDGGRGCPSWYGQRGRLGASGNVGTEGASDTLGSVT